MMSQLAASIEMEKMAGVAAIPRPKGGKVLLTHDRKALIDNILQIGR